MGRAGLILVSFLLMGCKTKYVPVETVIKEKVTVTDTIVDYQLVPYRDSVTVRDTVSFLSNEYGASWARYSDGILSHSLYIFPLSPIKITVPRTVLTEKTTSETKIVEVEKKLSHYQKFCINAFPLLLILLGAMGFIIYRVRK